MSSFAIKAIQFKPRLLSKQLLKTQWIPFFCACSIHIFVLFQPPKIPGFKIKALIPDNDTCLAGASDFGVGAYQSVSSRARGIPVCRWSFSSLLLSSNGSSQYSILKSCTASANFKASSHSQARFASRRSAISSPRIFRASLTRSMSCRIVNRPTFNFTALNPPFRSSSHSISSTVPEPTARPFTGNICPVKSIFEGLGSFPAVSLKL